MTITLVYEDNPARTFFNIRAVEWIEVEHGFPRRPGAVVMLIGKDIDYVQVHVRRLKCA